MDKKYIFALSVICLILWQSCQPNASEKSKSSYRFLVGTYTQKEGHVNGKAEGIYDVGLNMETGELTTFGIASDLVNPSFLAVMDSHHIYAVNEIGPNAKNYPGRVSHLVIDSLGKYRKSQEGSTFGNAPCHITIHQPSGMYAICNYLGGQLAYGSIGDDGSFNDDMKTLAFSGKSVNPRQESAHLHMSLFTNDGTRLLVSDLGSDMLRVHSVNLTSKTIDSIPLFTFICKAGDGPRHFCLSADETTAYILNELSNTVSQCDFNKESGKLTEVTRKSTLPDSFSGPNTSADIHLSPDGKYMYTSNRGHNSLALFKIKNKKTIPAGHYETGGKTPRNYVITRDGKYLIAANQDTDELVVFGIGKEGKLEKKFKQTVKTPVCLIEI
ncbi:MAG: lactonase family protein [Saprospiraceae bacterium]|nr:lactonase family protein [Saprospiraceae bacterium]